MPFLPPCALCEIPLLNNSHSVFPRRFCLYIYSGWDGGGGGHQLSAVTILSMARDGRLSATMVWLICIAVSPSGFWHESQAKLPHFHAKKTKRIHSTLHDPWKCPEVACWDFISSRGTRGNICFLILWCTHLIEMSEGKGSIVLGWHQEVSWYGWEWLGGTSRRGGYSVRK